MVVLESHWIAAQIDVHAHSAQSLVDVGSESPQYRTGVQKHIAQLYTLLGERSIKITTLDYDASLEPDIVQDITAPLENTSTYDVVLASNLLEHIPTEKLKTTISNLFSLVNADGIVIITVPFNLPKHDHPIDTMLRPGPSELISLVGHEAVESGQWTEIRYKEPYLSNPSLSPAPVVTGAVFRR